MDLLEEDEVCIEVIVESNDINLTRSQLGASDLSINSREIEPVSRVIGSGTNCPFDIKILTSTSTMTAAQFASAVRPESVFTNSPTAVTSPDMFPQQYNNDVNNPLDPKMPLGVSSTLVRHSACT